eukprot:TRINITY_DN3289_c0_g1_i1.p1 TRINITY_DN3289_c0_g1~~TRINITY_DN3289_c0_g1_i1.p1  ORF type:complete len:329 (-),score=56.41 TRINITY_DN3289_c0_g1_i1:260-1246(-)
MSDGQCWKCKKCKNSNNLETPTCYICGNAKSSTCLQCKKGIRFIERNGWQSPVCRSCFRRNSKRHPGGSCKECGKQVYQKSSFCSYCIKCSKCKICPAYFDRKKRKPAKLCPACFNGADPASWGSVQEVFVSVQREERKVDQCEECDRKVYKNSSRCSYCTKCSRCKANPAYFDPQTRELSELCSACYNADPTLWYYNLASKHIPRGQIYCNSKTQRTIQAMKKKQFEFPIRPKCFIAASLGQVFMSMKNKYKPPDKNHPTTKFTENHLHCMHINCAIYRNDTDSVLSKLDELRSKKISISGVMDHFRRTPLMEAVSEGIRNFPDTSR